MGHFRSLYLSTLPTNQKLRIGTYKLLFFDLITLRDHGHTKSTP